MTTLDAESVRPTFEFTRDELIDAPIEVVYQSMLEELGPEGRTPDGKEMNFKLEVWPGGRWYRDLGNNAGHLWGHVQVSKPPTLLEIRGPLFMSTPVINHLQYRLTSEGTSTRLKFTHTSFGVIPKGQIDGMQKGWGHWIGQISKRATGKK